MTLPTVRKRRRWPVLAGQHVGGMYKPWPIRQLVVTHVDNVGRPFGDSVPNPSAEVWGCQRSYVSIAVREIEVGRDGFAGLRYAVDEGDLIVGPRITAAGFPVCSVPLTWARTVLPLGARGAVWSVPSS